MPFRELAGQETAHRRLKQALHEGRLLHGLLFVGEEGSGREAVALAAVQLLLCEELAGGRDGPHDDACGTCSACQRVARGIHPDVLWVSGSDRSIGIDLVREAQAFLSRAPEEAARRIVVMGPAERLTEEAQNALLKTVEEPAGHAVLMLWAAAEGSLLSTLRSRVAAVPVELVPAEELARLLVAGPGLPADTAREVARVARGRAGWALRRGAALLEMDRAAGEVFRALAGGGSGMAAILAFAEAWARAEEREELLTLLEGWFADWVREGAGVPPWTHELLHGEPPGAPPPGAPERAAALGLLHEARRDLQRGRHPRLVLDRAFYRIALLGGPGGAGGTARAPA